MQKQSDALLDLAFWKKVRPEEIFARVASDEVRDHVLGVFGKLTRDPVWTDPIVDQRPNCAR